MNESIPMSHGLSSHLLGVPRCVDESVGRLMETLKELNLDENTVVIYSSDQGFYVGDHGWYDKRWMYEESLKMPFIIKWPEAIKPGSRNSTHMIQNLDYAETFLDIAKPLHSPPIFFCSGLGNCNNRCRGRRSMSLQSHRNSKGLTTFTSAFSKSATLRVETVSLCILAVAAIMLSLIGIARPFCLSLASSRAQLLAVWVSKSNEGNRFTPSSNHFNSCVRLCPAGKMKMPN